MEKQAKRRRKQTGYEACELTKVNTEVLCAVRVGFMSLWMTFSFLKFRLLKRTVNKQKNTVGLYWEVYFRKTKGIIKILVKKNKNKKY